MTLTIPRQMLPSDGRFGSGPSKVRPDQVATLAAGGTSLLGTSHRQPPVKHLVRRIREGIAELLGAPDGYEVVLGNGGSTAFWEVAAACLVTRRARCAVFGEFGSKFAAATARAPFLDAPDVIEAPAGEVVEVVSTVGLRPGSTTLGCDVFATVQNETSTGAAITPRRAPGDALTLIDATSAAGGLPIDLAQTDAYYFAPQKAFASDGGLWLAVLSPAAIERAERIERDLPSVADAKRWVPEFLSLTAAISNSRADQTLNTPAVATLIMLAEQIDWLLANGGLAWSVARCAASAATLYGWAEARDWATPFVQNPEHRSNVVGTIDLDESIDAKRVIEAMRDNGIHDVFPYRKLGRNQLRVAMFPAIDPSDVEALTACIDYVVETAERR